ncbi:hypothetical protein ATSB10_38620 [Dyella thiooxydans]|uniref:DUF2066 domain-containing protein n=1 Tax=Dyella thiooxydans TaxID=445710 RepID=A0A160N599_9GAMM|nr:DUF2066 domain-containing protein [Dyella thiooxydans]AND71316.1 hypothetical protein ATSB10_38620 [Dyella thiooxydans]
MRLSRLICILFLFGLAGLRPALAQQQATSSPYTVVMPVTDTSEAQRDSTFSSALAQVLARVAGGQDLRGKSGYDDALKSASGLVSQYQYQRSGDGIALQITFDRGAINHLVGQLGAPAAGVKPPVLLLVQGTDGSLLDGDSLDALARSAAAQGYGVVYPDPTQPPDLSRVAAVDPAEMAQLTSRYKTGLILVGKLHPGGVDWTLVSGGAAQSWQDQGPTEDGLFADAGAAMAARVGKQLNVIGSGTSDGKLWIDGVASAMDYAQLLNVLRGDPSVRTVTTLGAKDDGVLLEVSSSLPLSALASNLAAGGRLLQASSNHAGADASMRWLH